MYGNTGGSLRTEERWFNASPAPISLTMCPPLQWKNIHSGGARGIKLAGVYLCCFFYYCSHKRYTHLRSVASAHRSLTEDEIPKAITWNVLQRLGQMIPTPQRGALHQASPENPSPPSCALIYCRLSSGCSWCVTLEHHPQVIFTPT